MKGPHSKCGRSVTPAQEFKSLHLRHGSLQALPSRSSLLLYQGDFMKITVLAENTGINENMIIEHGLSLYIETDNHKILFDMGQTEAFAQNADELGINLEEVDFAVLSHGHYNHGGGLGKFLEINRKAPLYIQSQAFEPHFNGSEKYIGLDKALQSNPRIVFTEDYMKLADNIHLYSCNDKEKKYDLDFSGLNKIVNGQLVADDFLHEQYLLIEENGKKILISGCSHKGILNIVNWFDADVIIGGFHYSKFPLDDTMKDYAGYLDSTNAEFYTCHCTGVPQYEFMKKYMKNLSYLSTGMSIEI